MIPWKFADIGGDEITVREPGHPDHRGTAFEVNGGDSVIVPPHRLAGMVRAMYCCAGLPEPDLPDIPDPAEIEALARDLQNAHHMAAPSYSEQARWLIAEARWARKDPS